MHRRQNIVPERRKSPGGDTLLRRPIDIRRARDV
jgi:hypothetical protein